MNKKIVHDALILTAFTLVLGLILGLVHEITKAPIEAANLATTQAAYHFRRRKTQNGARHKK